MIGLYDQWATHQMQLKMQFAELQSRLPFRAGLATRRHQFNEFNELRSEGKFPSTCTSRVSPSIIHKFVKSLCEAIWQHVGTSLRLQAFTHSERHFQVLAAPDIHAGIVASDLLKVGFVYGEQSPRHGGSPEWEESTKQRQSRQSSLSPCKFIHQHVGESNNIITSNY